MSGSTLPNSVTARDAAVPRSLPAATGTSFRRRRIDVKFTLRAGSFADTGANTVTLTGLRVYCSIGNFGMLGAELSLRVFGMTQSQMGQLSLLGVRYDPYGIAFNIVRVAAGSVPDKQELPGPSGAPAEPVLTDMFTGIIQTAFANFQNMPEVSFEVTAKSTGFDAIKSVDPVSYSGSVDAVTILQNIAQKMQKQLINWGVPFTPILNPYYAGTAVEQATKVAAHANIHLTFHETSGNLEIWPLDGARGGGDIPVISPDSGMIGYPTYTQGGLIIKTLFNPQLFYGRKLQIKTSLPQRKEFSQGGRDGIYKCGAISHDLSCEAPGGQWFTQFECLHPSITVSAGGPHA